MYSVYDLLELLNKSNILKDSNISRKCYAYYTITGIKSDASISFLTCIENEEFISISFYYYKIYFPIYMTSSL